VGLENNSVEVVNVQNSTCKYQLVFHEGGVLSIRFASSAKWFISCSKDRQLAAWKSPFGPSIFQTREPNAILCSDISPCNQYIATGSSDTYASIYEVLY